MEVHLVSLTQLADKPFPGFIRYCVDHHLDPKRPIALKRYWEQYEADASTFLHVGLHTSYLEASELVAGYGFSVASTPTFVFIYGNLVSWGLLFRRKAKHPFTQLVAKHFKGAQLYELINI